MINEGWGFCADIPMMMWRGQKMNQDYVQSCARGTIDFFFSQSFTNYYSTDKSCRGNGKYLGESVLINISCNIP